MTPSDAAGSAAIEPSSVPRVRAAAVGTGDLSRLGRMHAVPVPALDIVGSSGRLAEALYRVFEILIAVPGLLFGLPVMLVEALLIRLDSPGPVLFFHMRPGRSIMVRGRELEGRPDLLPPPGGYRPDQL
jgi:hypothetical protein